MMMTTRIPIPRTVKLFRRDGKLYKELEVPQHYLYSSMPDVIFYGALAFQVMLGGRGQYTECSCWRAPEEREEEVKAAS